VEVKTVRFGKKSRAEVARFTPDGLVRPSALPPAQHAALTRP